MGDVYRIAVASEDGVNIKAHFGKARKFYIYEISDDGFFKETEIREVDPACNGEGHDNLHFHKTAEGFKDCRYVIAEKIGMGALGILENLGVEGYAFTGNIDKAIDELIRFKQVQDLFG